MISLGNKCDLKDQKQVDFNTANKWAQKEKGEFHQEDFTQMDQFRKTKKLFFLFPGSTTRTVAQQAGKKVGRRFGGQLISNVISPTAVSNTKLIFIFVGDIFAGPFDSWEGAGSGGNQGISEERICL